MAPGIQKKWISDSASGWAFWRYRIESPYHIKRKRGRGESNLVTEEDQVAKRLLSARKWCDERNISANIISKWWAALSSRGARILSSNDERVLSPNDTRLLSFNGVRILSPNDARLLSSKDVRLLASYDKRELSSNVERLLPSYDWQMSAIISTLWAAVGYYLLMMSGYYYHMAGGCRISPSDNGRLIASI